MKPIDVPTVQSILEYRPELGGSCLAWKIAPRYGVNIGDRAGHLTARGYWLVKIKNQHYFAHRLVWAVVKGEDPVHAIDHINGKEQGNYIENLRIAFGGAKDNSQNMATQKNNTSGYTGVYWDAAKRKWRAQIKKDGKKIRLGMFCTPEKAYAAYLKAKEKLHIFNPVPRDVKIMGATPFAKRM